MRPIQRYLVAGVAVLALHILAALLVAPYRDLLIDLGGRFVRANDIADLPEVMLAGLSVSGVVLLAATMGVVYFASPRGGPREPLA